MKTILYRILALVLRMLVRAIGRTVYRLRISGVSNIPAQGGALLVANHASYLDFVLMVSAVPRPVRFVMNADMYHKRGLKWLMRGMNFIPIAPRGGNNNFDDFNQAVTEQINNGHLVVIFAEGTVSRTGQLLEFKKGVEHLSSIITAPVIPIHFDNVQGTPFTFRGGKKRAEKFSFKTIRREVLVNIGQPIKGKISAYMLRQKMKEMEVANFNLRVSGMNTLDIRLMDDLSNAALGQWSDYQTTLAYADLRKQLALLNEVLNNPLNNARAVAVLLPKSVHSHLINLWLVVNKKVAVNLNSEFSNEERFYVCNKARIDTLITTRDLNFTRFAPTTEKVIYIEDIIESLATGKEVNVVCKRINTLSKHVTSWFAKPATHEDVVAIFFQKKNREEMQCVSLTHRNFLAVLASLRQVYHFEKGSRLLANIDLSNVYGFVLEFLLPLVSDLKLDIVDSQDNANDYLNTLQQIEPDLVLASPAQLEAIASLAQIKNIPYLKTVFTAEVLPDNYAIEILSQRGVQVMVCAGMMETTSVYAVNIHNYHGRDIVGKKLEQENYQEGSNGKAIPGVAIKICHSENASLELLNDEVGTLWVKGAAVAPSKAGDYECAPKLVDGWYNTGLTGRVNHKGFIKINL